MYKRQVPDSAAEDITTVDFSHGAVTVIGNEGNGVSKEVKAFSDRFITCLLYTSRCV